MVQIRKRELRVMVDDLVCPNGDSFMMEWLSLNISILVV